MKTEVLLQEIQKIPEYEKEVLWYLNQYPNSNTQPWLDIIDEVFLNFNITYPASLKDINKKQLIAFIILTKEYQIVEDKTPGYYRIMFNNEYLDEFENTSTILIGSFLLLISIYYKAEEEDWGLDNLHNKFKTKIQEWNFSTYVKQEQVKFLADEFLLNKVALFAKVSEKDVSNILLDYHSRMEKKKLKNLQLFLDEIEYLMDQNADLKKHMNFLEFIVQEIKNGGSNLNSPYDLIPNYKGIQFN